MNDYAIGVDCGREGGDLSGFVLLKRDGDKWTMTDAVARKKFWWEDIRMGGNIQLQGGESVKHIVFVGKRIDGILVTIKAVDWSDELVVGTAVGKKLAWSQ